MTGKTGQRPAPSDTPEDATGAISSPVEVAARPHRNTTISAVAYEATRALARFMDGDFGMKPWEEASDAIRQNMMTFVASAIGQPRLNAAQVHEQWRATRQQQGWQWGPKHSAAERTDPRLQSFQGLDTSQRVRLGIIVAIVREMQNAVD